MSQFEEQEFQSNSFDGAIWKKIIKLLAPFKKLIIQLMLLNVLIASLDVAFPYMNKLAVDVFLTKDTNPTHLALFALVYFIGVAIQAGTVYGFFYLAGKIEMYVSYDVRKKCFEKLHSLSFSYFDKTPIGWLMARMTSDISRLSEIVSWSMMDLAWGVSVMIGVTVVMLITNWKLAMLVLIVVPFLAYISAWFQVRILKNYRDVRKINSRITSSFNEGITGAKTTKTLVLEENNFKEFNEETHHMREASIRAAMLSSLFMPIVMGLGSFSTAALLVQGGQQVLLKQLEFGTLLMFTQYATQFFEPLRQLARLIAEFQMAQASAERIVSLLETESAIVDDEKIIKEYGSVFEPNEEIKNPIVGDIEFKHVDFYYNKEEPVLTDFNLKVKAGQTVALVGETGSGKSSIVNLLCRFYEPVQGEILIDGTDYRQRSISWLHRQLGYVLQSPHLFSGTIKDNVRIGRPDATDEEIRNACRIVNADEFIMKLDRGYDTDVGEGGNRLSVGQKQLISFARAILVNPALFILDEATASIDTETEKIIQYAIENILKDKTSFVIAHRLSTIVNADVILVIKKGVIVEQGTHDELMRLKGYYYRLYTNQFNDDLQRQILGKGEEA